MTRTAPSRRPASEPVVLHIALKHIKPVVWRRVIVPANITLNRLHRVIQAAMGWENLHLHEFEIAGTRYGLPDPYGWDLSIHPEARRSLLKTLSGQHRFRYLYDFGDDWDHDIRIEPVPVGLTDASLPCCLEGAQACPPEDVGGQPGYEAFLEAMADPAHPEHDTMLAWYGTPFDPAAFDLASINHRLAKIKV